MKSRIPLLAILLAGMLFFACEQRTNHQVSIQGEIEHLGQGILVVTYNNAWGELSNDTIETTSSGQFSFKLEVPSELTPVTIRFHKKGQWTTLFAESGDKIRISGDLKMVDLLQVKGGVVNDELMVFKNQITPLYQERMALLQSSFATENAAMVRLAEINLALKRSANDFIREHPSSVASVVLIQDFFYQDYDPSTADLLGTLRGGASRSPLAEKMRTGVCSW